MRGVFDAHLHVIDSHFPLVPNHGFVPEPYPAAAYLRDAQSLGVVAGAVVAGSFQGNDTSYLIDALDRLGPAFVGVAELPAAVTNAEILELHRAGVRAVRFNARRGDPAAITGFERLARRVFDLAGWHAEVYADGNALGHLEPLLRKLPRVTIDHLGLDDAGLAVALRLVDVGARVKASGFGRVTFDVPEALRAVAAVNPNALMFGTDLPSTRAPRPFLSTDVEVVREALGDAHAGLALHDNATDWYRPKEPACPTTTTTSTSTTSSAT